MNRLYFLESEKVVVDLLTGRLLINEPGNLPDLRTSGASAANQSPSSDCTTHCESIDGEQLVLTIETTRDCNLACIYCYQNDRKTKETISRRTIDLTLDYIENALSRSGKTSTIIRLIGGEPLLARKEILYLTKEIRERHLEVAFHIDTNGRVPIQWFLDEDFRCELFICLSLPSDHNRVRYSSGHDSASAIYTNISNLSLRKGQSIAIAYNVHNQNMHDFTEFLDWIEPLHNNPVTSVITTRIDNYPFNLHAFNNTLSETAFSEWRAKVAIPALIARGWRVPFVRISEPRLCQGHQPYSCKIYADGKVTICDAMQIEDSRTTIEELSINIEAVNQVYSDIKRSDPWKCQDCQTCPSHSVCFGRKWCQSDSCNPRLYDHILISNRAIIEASLRKRK